MPRARKVYAPLEEGEISFGYSTWQVKKHVVQGLSRDDPRLAELVRIFGLTLSKPSEPEPEVELGAEPEPEISPELVSTPDVSEEVNDADFGAF